MASKIDIKIKKYEDIFKNETSNISNDGIVLISTSLLKDFESHPFKVEGSGMDELMESITTHGILSPILVRPLKEGYEVIAGHRRKHCALKLGLEKVPAIVKQISDDEAILAMVDSNIQREDILPSEKAFAYKMKLEAMKRQGQRNDLTYGQVGRKLESAETIGEDSQQSGRQIRRYIRLTELPPFLLNAIDNKKMSFNAGVELSFLNSEEKNIIEQIIKEINKFPSLEQAKKIHSLSGNISKLDVMKILSTPKSKTNEPNLEREDIRSFFPNNYTAKQIEDAIIEILKNAQGTNNNLWTSCP